MRRSCITFFLRKIFSQSMFCIKVWIFVTLFMAKPIATGKSVANIMSMIRFPVFRELTRSPMVWMLSSPLPSPNRSIYEYLCLQFVCVQMLQQLILIRAFGGRKAWLFTVKDDAYLIVLENYRKLIEFLGSKLVIGGKYGGTAVVGAIASRKYLLPFTKGRNLELAFPSFAHLLKNEIMYE